MLPLLTVAIGVVLSLPSLASSQTIRSPGTSGFGPATDALISAYRNVDVVVLGEAHGRKPDSDFRLALVRNAKFAETVRVIVLEAPQPELQTAVDEVNQALPPERRIQVFVNSTPNGGDRNATAVALVREQALDKGQKALVVFGSGHVWRRFGGVTTLLEQHIPGRVHVVETIAPVAPGPSDSPAAAAEFATAMRAFQDTLRNRQWPVLVDLAGSGAGTLLADPFYMGQAMLGPDTTLSDLADSVVFFGMP